MLIVLHTDPNYKTKKKKKKKKQTLMKATTASVAGARVIRAIFFTVIPPVPETVFVEDNLLT